MAGSSIGGRMTDSYLLVIGCVIVFALGFLGGKQR